MSWLIGARRPAMTYNYPLLDAFLTMLWFFLFVLWLFLLFRVVLDIFRDNTLKGWHKAGWLIFTIVLPYLGVLVYLIVRGAGMGERAEAEARRNKEAFDDYIRQTAGPAAGQAPSHAEQLSRLAELKANGTLTEQEFEQAKAKLLS
jgi:hypothetical protein